MNDQGEIHDEHPFATPIEDRDPVRRFRGRLRAPVTIVTAGNEDERTGLTVSSLMVAEGEPGKIYLLLGATTDLYQAIQETGKFIVHVCVSRHRELADVFAGLRPSPGGMFRGQEVVQTDWGPALSDLTTRAYCTYRGGQEETYLVIATGDIDHVEIDDMSDPLSYFRGSYSGPA